MSSCQQLREQLTDASCSLSVGLVDYCTTVLTLTGLTGAASVLAFFLIFTAVSVWLHPVLLIAMCLL